MRLTSHEREHISTSLAQGRSHRQIALDLGRPTSTICREVTRHADQSGRYSAFRAQAESERRASSRHAIRKIDKNPLLRQIVISALKLHWSPEQIAGMIRRAFPGEPLMTISHESIYTYLYVQAKGTLKTELTHYLRRERSERKPRLRRAEARGKIPDMISIHQRPIEVADRTIPGHWEGDLIMGAHNRSALGTLAERTTRFLLLVALDGHDAETVREAFAAAMLQLPVHLRLSLTWDQGKEMSEHRLFTRATNIQVYFADPHSPWQRGTNENTNGLVRQYFPKGTDFTKVMARDILAVQNALNLRPRKTLDFHSPHEMFSKLYKHNEEIIRLLQPLRC